MLVWMYVASAMYDKCSCMYVLVQSILLHHFIWMYMFMGLLAQMVNAMVPSSSSVKGLGMLQRGIRAHVAAWAWMDHQDALTVAGFLSAQQGSESDDSKLPKICLSVEQSEHLVEKTSNVAEELVERTFDVAEELDESTPDGNSLNEKSREIYLSVRCPLERFSCSSVRRCGWLKDYASDEKSLRPSTP